MEAFTGLCRVESKALACVRQKKASKNKGNDFLNSTFMSDDGIGE